MSFQDEVESFLGLFLKITSVNSESAAGGAALSLTFTAPSLQTAASAERLEVDQTKLLVRSQLRSSSGRDVCMNV